MPNSPNVFKQQQLHSLKAITYFKNCDIRNCFANARCFRTKISNFSFGFWVFPLNYSFSRHDADKSVYMAISVTSVCIDEDVHEFFICLAHIAPTVYVISFSEWLFDLFALQLYRINFKIIQSASRTFPSSVLQSWSFTPRNCCFCFLTRVPIRLCTCQMHCSFFLLHALDIVELLKVRGRFLYLRHLNAAYVTLYDSLESGGTFFHDDNLKRACTSNMILFATMIWWRFRFVCFAKETTALRCRPFFIFCTNNTAHTNYGCMPPYLSYIFFSYTYVSTASNFYHSSCFHWLFCNSLHGTIDRLQNIDIFCFR